MQKKWISEERLTELEIKRKEHLIEKRNQPIQMKIENFLREIAAAFFSCLGLCKEGIQLIDKRWRH